ncbi:DUF3080 domain-containing protein [Halomonas qinghailakensis]|uniref:DUF3080 domain-containing protein n=2 Tax=Halomonas TaxID=2745 RepID=A0AA46TSP4_9GAMM|nr:MULTISPECIES: DUF3080 family protein [Halomonas]UYO74852.1 DUF3080 domain-containing protein [Halomonas sp. ZZQ-149]UYV20219.1 DUF3080 domain-containing protein [Halomonas qaidamensis]
MTPYPQRLLWLAVSASLFLAGCNNSSAEQPWIEYHQQLTSDLSIATIERYSPSNVGEFPERRERLFDIPETREGMLNVYALRECQITSLIAARNNQLGRVAPPSQQWLYERELWQRLSACWNSDVPDSLSDDNKARLAQLTELKTEQLPAVSWNAIFDSEEWEKSFSRASDPLDSASLPNINKHLAAVAYLEQMVVHQFNSNWQQDSATLENHLKTLQERPLTAEVLRTVLLAYQRLTEANEALESTQPKASVCLQDDFPAWLAPVEQISLQWLTAINQLINIHEITPPEAVKNYQNTWLSLRNPQAPWQQLQRVKIEHQALRDQFNRCSDN